MYLVPVIILIFIMRCPDIRNLNPSCSNNRRHMMNPALHIVHLFRRTAVVPKTMNTWELQTTEKGHYDLIAIHQWYRMVFYIYSLFQIKELTSIRMWSAVIRDNAIQMCSNTITPPLLTKLLFAFINKQT